MQFYLQDETFTLHTVLIRILYLHLHLRLLLVLVVLFFLDRNGSVVVFFTLIFNEVVRIDDVILVLKNAAKNGFLGDLEVDSESIIALVSVSTTPATNPPTTRTTSGKLIRHFLYV